MFVITLSDILGIAILAVILVGCIIYFVHESFVNARYLRGYHKPSKREQALQAQKEKEEAERKREAELKARQDSWARLKKSDPKLYKKQKAKLYLGYMLIFAAFIGLCMLVAWIKKR